CVGNARLVGALRAMKRYLDYGMFKPIQRAAVAALDDDAYAEAISQTYERRRNALCDALSESGWRVPRPRATMFVWAKLPATIRATSLDFARELLDRTGVAVAPGATFGAAGEGFVRFGLVEPENRLREAGRRVGAFVAGAPRS